MEGTLKDHLYALIVCGGSGTRLWPRSRQKTPKQFLEKFYGEKTLFTQTVERANLLTPSDKIFVITTNDYADEVLQQGEAIPAKNIITEPFGKNTAMAIGVGAAYIKKADPEAMIMNFWSDAAIGTNELFVDRLNLAVKVANQGNYLVIIGLQPAFPHTGLGYIEVGEKLSGMAEAVYRVSSFKEKPDLKTAREFIQKGNFFWNTGILVWSARAIFEAFSKYSPEIYNLLEKVFAAIDTGQEREELQKAYEQAENISIEYAVSEKAGNLLLVPGDFTWSDIGDWKVVYDLKEKDADRNVVEVFGKDGWHMGIETKNCLVEAENRLIATVGVSDLVIVETKDAILVCAKDKAQDVKKIVNSLKEKEKEEYL
ncbi:MAG TPA: sugar phosphate nucleotidyltransferase [Patescibacteria group bacterium]|nr:sugar phosphate nucleotidyltransferase [Patescibacteria group bacterium]